MTQRKRNDWYMILRNPTARRSVNYEERHQFQRTENLASGHVLTLCHKGVVDITNFHRNTRNKKNETKRELSSTEIKIKSLGKDRTVVRMTVDLDTANDINEKLNGLVNLLQIVGIDGVDASALVAESKRKSGGSTTTTKTAGSSDSQILELVKKLQQAQEESPELLEALKIPELRALATLAAQKKGNAPAPAPPASLDDVMDDDDDNYPKIGPGYSDDISVVSDLTTPTVMTKQNIADEEYYRDVNGGPSSGPPIHIGGPSRLPMAIGAGTRKSKNMLNNVSAAKAGRAIGKAAAGGAAAQRRELQKQIQAKLQESPPLKTPKTPRSKPRSSPEEKRYMDAFDTSYFAGVSSNKLPMDRLSGFVTPFSCAHPSHKSILCI